ncbi:hypothetical protein AB3N60_11185 [Leptospira sp. WS39.C2]
MKKYIGNRKLKTHLRKSMISKFINSLFSIVIFIFTLASCQSTRYNFEISKVTKRNKINFEFDEIVLHFEFKIPARNPQKDPRYHLKEGIIENLKNCNIQKKIISIYTGYFQFLNYVSNDKLTLTDNFLTENPRRIDLTLIFLESDKWMFYSSSNNTFIQNFELYFYSISNPLFHYEVLEKKHYEPFNFDENHLNDHHIFGSTLGKHLCSTLNELQ